MNQHLSSFRGLLSQTSVKLVVALVAIFFFFVVAIGVQEAVTTYLSNREILTELKEAGVPPDERQQDRRLTSPWWDGYDASLRFLGRRNLEMITLHTTIVGMAALGMTLVIISGGIDLSVGSIVALSSVVIAWLLQYAGAGPLTAALGGVAAAALFGLLSGLLITWLRVVPFIVTLGMMLVVRGAAKGLANEQKIDVDMARQKWLPELLHTIVGTDHSWTLAPAGLPRANEVPVRPGRNVGPSLLAPVVDVHPASKETRVS